MKALFVTGTVIFLTLLSTSTQAQGATQEYTCIYQGPESAVKDPTVKVKLNEETYFMHVLLNNGDELSGFASRFYVKERDLVSYGVDDVFITITASGKVTYMLNWMCEASH